MYEVTEINEAGEFYSLGSFCKYEDALLLVEEMRQKTGNDYLIEET